ncbi:hypothetical protein [Corallibacter sp.]|uniref:hypothetical protein n=1 Tax=Corallibacter sp. TaxID=2038084 RepID=UPI003A912559
MKKRFILMGIIVIACISKIQAQIGIAVAKNNGSAVEWRVSWGNGSAWDCKMAARKHLENKGYKKVYTQDCNSKCGHSVSSGYYVVVKGTYKSYDGNNKTDYGLGASSSSYSEAKARAIANLSTYSCCWKKSSGVSIEKQGTY